MVVYVGRDFVIRTREIDDVQGEEAECAWLFADFRTQNGVITEIYDLTSPHKAMIAALQDDNRFHEACIFEVHDLYENAIVVTFEGTFIDALTYLKDNMRTIQDEGEKNA